MILVLGGTGTGKSSFVATTSGQAVGVGHDLRSFTATCQAVEFNLADRQVVQLIDTPGFSDTSRPDLDVLKAIAGWLQTNKAAIAGVVYLHRIDERRFTGTHRLVFDIVRAICGKHFYPHLVLCTTMWDKLHRDVLGEAEERESELVGAEDLWNPLLERQAEYMRYTGDRASGLAIIQKLLEHPATGKMELQLELRNPCDVEDTRAGRVITAELRKKEERLRQERLKEEEEERELREQLSLEREALQRDEQKKREQEAAMFRRTDRRSSGGSRNERRPRESRDVREVVPSTRSNRDGKGRLTELHDGAGSASQSRWGLGFLRK
ncbi:uncharacterized protein EKO05_0005630 [Ascochyta rabiei]|uniref:GTP binding n=1 Tax=Didymella rabiei TaxID=5454 RepID=A0A163FEP9_DIDRA|nr:uncharacterized protein EKO05_0005630 [Ascochyta rabiei]KZM24314.1 GTP binding [Ascochyta rabiei]UPX15173.1 hypothetical protein EKO05_0005630 [Ascochyta rabiei]